MANKRIKGITIEIGADTMGLDKALKGVESGANKAKEELRDVDRALRNAPDSAVLWSQKQELLTKAIEESRKKVELLRNAQEQVNRQFQEGKISEEQYRAFQREVESAEAEVRRLSEQLDNLGTEARTATGELEELGEETADTGDGFTILKGTIAELAADGVGKAIECFKELAFEGTNALNLLQTSTGATAEQMDEYSKVLSNLYANNYGENKIDLAESIAQVKQQLGEIDGEELENTTEKALLLRDTFDFEVNESIRTADMLMTQFEMSADEAYTLIAQNGLNKNDDLLDTINEYSVHYKQMGYTGEEFFNSLINGAEAGTFSVDKLGDAMKEFGIRTKDGSDSTVEAFTAIGLVSADMSEDIKKTNENITKYQKNISDLEQKIKYAKLEQAEFNEKTSDLKKLKMEDNLKKWNNELKENKQNLSDAQAFLVNCNNNADSAKYTVDELFSKFASGGQTAREATQEVIDALFAMEDKVAQDAAGVQLFGTMWEDLGADGVKALMDINGEADKSATVLQDIADIRYDDLNSRFEGVKRQIGEEFLKPIAEDMMPKIEKSTDYLVKHLPQIKQTISNSMPLVKGIGTSIASWKLANTVSKGVDAFKNLTTALKATDTAARKLNTSMAASPIVAVGTAILGASIAVSEYLKQCEPYKTELDKLLEKEQEYMQSVRDTRDAINEKKEAGHKAAEADIIQLDKAEDLWKELDKLADSTGKVKEKDQERVQFILNELNEAFGTEYQLVDDQIQKYDELKDSIDKVIQMKRANIYLEAGEEAYSAALLEVNNLEDKQIQNEKELRALKEEQAKLKKNDGSSFTRDDYKYKDKIYAQLDYERDILEMKANKAKKTDIQEYYKFLSDIKKIDDEKALYEKNAKIYTDMDNLSTRIKQLDGQLSDYYEDIADHEAAKQAMFEENYDEVIKLTTGKSRAERKYTEDLGAESTKQLEILKNNYEEACIWYDRKLTQYKNGVAGITQETVNAAFDARVKAQIEFETLAKSCEESTQTFANSVQKILGTAYTINFKKQDNNIASSMLFETLNIPMHAKGGYISGSSVGRGIVAEAGPELLEIVNGGVKITPLSDTARNTAVGGNSNDIKIYNTFHVQKMDKDTDIYSVSEKLARITSESLRGKGLI
ncbi:MAG: phage tail tape measure protein [Ruminococcus sp.]|nr:phage tail tape measure protein [Ruminococcus sp.]